MKFNLQVSALFVNNVCKLFAKHIKPESDSMQFIDKYIA